MGVDKEVCKLELTIKGVRKAKGKTVEEMAELLGVSENSYRKYENNPEEMKVKYVKIIAKELKVPVQFFFYNEQ